MLSAVLNAGQLLKVDDLSDDDQGPTAATSQKATRATSGKAAASVQATPIKQTTKAKPVCKRPAGKSAKACMKRPASAPETAVASQPPTIKAWKCKYHKKNMCGIKVQIGKEKVKEVLTVPGTTNYCMLPPMFCPSSCPKPS